METGKYFVKIYLYSDYIQTFRYWNKNNTWLFLQWQKVKLTLAFLFRCKSKKVIKL